MQRPDFANGQKSFALDLGLLLAASFQPGKAALSDIITALVARHVDS